MIKSKSIFSIIFSVIFLLISADSVSAACVVKVNSNTCPANMNIVTGNSGVEACATSNFSQNQLGQFVERAGNDLKVCPKIAGVVNYTYKTVRDTGDAGGALLTRAVCCPGDTVPIRYWSGPFERVVCCNPSYTYAIGNTWADTSVSAQWNESQNSWIIEESITPAINNTYPTCKTQGGSEINANGDTDPVNAPASQMTVPVDGWHCGGSAGTRNCRLISGDPQNPDEFFVTKALCEQGAECVRHNDVLPSDSTKRCVDGRVQDASVPTVIPTPVTSAPGCESIDQIRLPQEYQACIRCANQCPTCVYSSIGCVDVSRDGLVTRVFQIGVGLIGGIMIIRFIQAALKMQTDNPEEIKEAQAMITSAILALLVLVGAVVILRFLGINVLGILPADFLQASPTPTTTP